MARKPRIHYPGALYHVICRGNNWEWILRDSAEKVDYLETIGRYKKRYQFKIYAYCVMDNHVHLLIEVGFISLSRIMQGIQLVYTQHYNRKHHRSGHVFEQRYQAIHCDKDHYLLSLINYIHTNPVRAGMESGLDYEWSSHRAYVGAVRDSLADTPFPLSLFEGTPVEQRDRYIKYMETEKSRIKELKPADFAKNRDEYEENRKDNEEQIKVEQIRPEIIILKVCKYYKLSRKRLKEKTKQSDVVAGKRAAMLLLKAHSGLNNTEISKRLNVSVVTVSMTLADERIQDRMKTDIERIRISETWYHIAKA